MIRNWVAERLLDYLAFCPLNRGKYRLAQLNSFWLDGIPVRSRYGPRLHTRFADSTFWLAARYGNDEVMALINDLSANDAFVDVGANIGLTTCYAAPRCSAVLALEASPREFGDLLRNCALLNDSRHHRAPQNPVPVCLLAAAADQQGFLPFRIGHISHSGGNSLGESMRPDDDLTVVESIRLDNLLNEQALARWPSMNAAYRQKKLVVKVDVEGFEAVVLRGMSALLQEQRCRKVIVEVNQQRAARVCQNEDIDAFMAQHRYYPTIHADGRQHFDQCYLPNR